MATWTVEGDVPATDTWLLSTTLVGGPDGPIHQFGVKFDGDQLIAMFVFDHVAAQQYNLGGSPQRLGAKWTAVFPLGDLAVADAGSWMAALTIGPANVSTIDGNL